MRVLSTIEVTTDARATATRRATMAIKERRGRVPWTRRSSWTSSRRSSGRAAGRAFAVAALMRGPSIHG